MPNDLNDETDDDKFSSDGNSDYAFSVDSESDVYIESDDGTDSHIGNENEEDADISIPSTLNNNNGQTINSDFLHLTGNRHSAICPEYRSLGGPMSKCTHCQAMMWDRERINKGSKKSVPIFSLCCGKGQIKLPLVKPTPKYLLDLHKDKEKGTKFLRSIRTYNAMLNFSSIGGKIDHGINKGRGPKIFRMSGINHHKMGSMLPPNGETPKFCQLYIYDTENEVENRMKSMGVHNSNNIDPGILESLITMLEENNHLVQTFRMARDRFKNNEVVDLNIVMKVSRSTSGRENHITPSDEIAVLMVGDDDPKCEDRDIVVEKKIGGLKRISSLHPLMMSLQYPVLFPHGEDGFHKKIFYHKNPGEHTKKRENVTMREYYCYAFMVRLEQGIL